MIIQIKKLILQIIIKILIQIKNYLITYNEGYAKSYDYNENRVYHIYDDNDYESRSRINGVVDGEEKIVKFIELSRDGDVRICNFHAGELMDEMNVDEFLFGICLWNGEYLFV